MSTWPMNTNVMKTAIMIAAAAVITRAVWVWPTSTARALPEPVPASVNELSYDAFTACDITARPMSRPIHAMITTKRCR